MCKSELAAAVALLLLCGDGEERAEVYGCAADRNQAKIVFDVAVDMVRFCPALSKRVKILESQKKITYLPTNSSYQVLSADVANKHGFNTHGVIFDELHTQPNRKLFDVMLQGSGDARMQPLYFLITTAGNDTNSICYEVHQKAIDIAEGRKVDPTFYSVIYGAAEDEDWTDPKVWKKANPSLGITVGIDKVKAACESAQQNPGEENAFRQLRLNQWVKQSVRWMPMDKWDACAFPVSEDDLEGRICYGGLDLSSTTDITAFVLVFPPLDEEDKYYVLPYFWIPEETLDLRVRRDHVPYDLWERQGTLMTTEGNVVHYGYIEKFIEQLGERFNIREIAFDRWGAVQMVQNLEGMGFTVVPFGQGFFTGDGSGKPLGILAASGGAETGITAASATAITADELIDLFYSLKSPYRRNAVWVLNDSTIKAVRKLKDGSGQYLWQPSLTAGTPDTILGRPVRTSAYMPAIAASAKTIAFGDFSYYWIADRQGRSFKRLNELYAANGQVGFLASQRVDGKMILPEAVKVLVQKAS